MDSTHLHLLVNHFPIVGTLLALPLFGLALARRHEPGLLLGPALLLVVATLAGGIALRTGEGAEEAVEDLPGVAESWIHTHEERAEPAMVVTALAAAGAAVLAFRGLRTGSVPVIGTLAGLATTVVAATLMVRTGAAGGVIRHEEIRGTTATLAAED